MLFSLANSGSEQVARPRKTLFYAGSWYDVTEWTQKHPGGKIIEFYCNSGEDATQAIQQFHLRSFDRVQRLMAPMKIDQADAKIDVSGTVILFITFYKCFSAFRVPTRPSLTVLNACFSLRRGSSIAL